MKQEVLKQAADKFRLAKIAADKGDWKAAIANKKQGWKLIKKGGS